VYRIKAITAAEERGAAAVYTAIAALYTEGVGFNPGNGNWPTRWKIRLGKAWGVHDVRIYIYSCATGFGVCIWRWFVKGRRESGERGLAEWERDSSKRTSSVCMKMLDTRGHKRAERQRER